MRCGLSELACRRYEAASVGLLRFVGLRCKGYDFAYAS